MGLLLKGWNVALQIRRKPGPSIINEKNKIQYSGKTPNIGHVLFSYFASGQFFPSHAFLLEKLANSTCARLNRAVENCF